MIGLLLLCWEDYGGDRGKRIAVPDIKRPKLSEAAMELGLNCPRSDQMVQIRHRMSPWGNGHPEALQIV
jgi:hypothetical protein